MPKKLDATKVKQDFDYCPDTGLLSYIGNGRKRKKDINTVINNCACNKSYIRIGVYGRQIYAHRIIWVWMTGENPETVDHIDGNGLNNKWSNLRAVAHSNNMKNQKLHSTNTSGVMGVTYRKDIGKWRARIMVNGRPINLGSYESKEAAIQAREDALKTHGFHENHGKRLAA